MIHYLRGLSATGLIVLTVPLQLPQLLRNPSIMSRMPSISSLMSPPEPRPLDSFDSPAKTSLSPLTPKRQSKDCKSTPSSTMLSATPEGKSSRVLPSPPVSPWMDIQQNVNNHRWKGRDGEEGAGSQRDPVLYPDHRDQESSAEPPLFPSSPARSYAEEIVSQHMASHMAQFQNKINQPTREEYLLALSCVSNVGRSYNQNPGLYLKRVRDENDEYYSKAKRICGRPGISHIGKVKIAPAQPIKQPKRHTMTPKQPKPITRVKRTPKSSPKERLINFPSTGHDGTPEGGRIASVKRPEDVDYRALPDFCPPISTLPLGNPKALKTDWASNNPLNISDDPDRSMLHEAELNLASTLRLTCATYLCSKRRIFEGRVKAFKNGKEFRKTDAQQACKIDVNKASKLWTAYEKVGWFNKAHFEQYL